MGDFTEVNTAIVTLKFAKLRVSNIRADLEDVAARVDHALRLLEAEAALRESPAAPSTRD